MADLPIRDDIASDDLIVWSNQGDNLSGDRYFTTVETLTRLSQKIAPAGGAITQATSASTGVTLSKRTGQITTFALTTAAAAEEEFTVTNTEVAATDVVAVSTTYAGAGTPAVTVKGVANGSFKIVITNLHASVALNAAVVINFVVLKGAAA